MSSIEERFEQDALAAEFERNWRPHCASVKIEDFLARIDEPSRPALLRELIAVECELRARIGETPQAADYHARFPEWSSRVGSGLRAFLGGGGDTGLAPDRPKRIGDFRIMRELGRGGMGIVYEAIQESLQRRVAIKIVTAHPLYFADQLHRFQREAQAVAALHHSNIVEVYGTGEEDGLHYFAM